MASNVDRPERAVQRVFARVDHAARGPHLNLPDELSEIGECNFCGCPLDGGDASKRTVDFVRGVCVVSVSRALYRDGAYQPRTQTRRCDCALRRSAPLRSARRTALRSTHCDRDAPHTDEFATGRPRGHSARAS